MYRKRGGKRKGAKRGKRGASFGKSIRIAGNYLKKLGIGKQVKQARNIVAGRALAKLAG
jgi:hypothetical protein